MDIEFDPDKHVALTKEQWEVLRRGQEVMNKLWNDPTDGLDFKRKVKKVRPDWAIPEVDIVDQAAAPVNAAIKSLSDKLDSIIKDRDDEKKTAKEQREESDLKSRLEQARKDYQLTDEGLDKVVAYMKEHNVGDPMAAAARVTDLLPKPKPTSGSSYAPQSANLYGTQSEDDQWKLLHTNPNAFFDQQVADILDHPENYPELRGAAA